MGTMVNGPMEVLMVNKINEFLMQNLWYFLDGLARGRNDTIINGFTFVKES